MTTITVNKNLELKSGLEWVKQSFFTFRERPLQFIILALFTTLISFLPLVGAFISPLLVARFAAMAEKVEHQEAVRVSMLFDGLFANRTIVRLGFLSFCLNAIISIAHALTEFYLRKNGFEIGSQINSITLIFIIPTLILGYAMWLSPVICLYHPDIHPKSAMWLSIKAGLYNIPTILCYSIIILVLTILAILPVGLGLLIWLPILNIAVYHIYKSIFLNSYI